MREPAMTDGLFRMLRFLQHHLQRSLEHATLRLEGVDEAEGEDRDVQLEVGHALVEGLEFAHGWLLDPFSALGRWEPELAHVPAPGGSRTVAALGFSPAPGMARPLGLPPRERLIFDGVNAYLVRGDRARLWLEVGPDGPRAVSSGKLPIVG